MTKLVTFPEDQLKAKHSFWDFDQFTDNMPLTGGATSKYVVTNAAVADDSPCTPVSIASGADNANSFIHDRLRPLYFRSGKPITMMASFGLSELTTTGEVNYFLGFGDATAGATIMPDDGAGATTLVNGAGFFARDGSTSLWVVARNGANTGKEIELTQDNLNNLSNQTILASSAVNRELKIEVRDRTDKRQDVVFWVDGIKVASIILDPTGGVKMGRVAIVKSGSATPQSAGLDWWGIACDR